MIKITEKINRPGLRIDIEKKFLEMDFINPNKNCDIFINKNQRYYFKNIWDGVDVSYKKYRKNIKETIKINSKSSSHILKFKINTNNSKTNMFNFEHFKVLDSNEKEIKDCLSVSFNKNNGIFEIKMKHLDEYIYPITII